MSVWQRGSITISLGTTEGAGVKTDGLNGIRQSLALLVDQQSACALSPRSLTAVYQVVYVPCLAPLERSIPLYSVHSLLPVKSILQN